MPTKVTFTVYSKIDGKRTFLKEYTIEGNTPVFIGRNNDCGILIPASPEELIQVSRYHTLVEINGDDVVVRDAGSLNGTYYNDKLMGKRPEGETPEQGRKRSYVDFEVKNGDSIMLGSVCEVQFTIKCPKRCSICGVELTEPIDNKLVQSDGKYICSKCLEDRGSRCKICGKKLGYGSRDGICADCLADPEVIMRLHLAQLGKADDAALKNFFGNMKKIRELGSGGMGRVYLVENTVTHKRYAYKVMLPRVAADQHHCDMFLREARNGEFLHNDHIVEQYASGSRDGGFFILMEYCEGGDLNNYLEEKGKKVILAPIRAAELMYQLLDGLDYIHHAKVNVRLKDGTIHSFNGLVHRDLKPQNIFVVNMGAKPCIKIGDLGLSKSFEAAGLSGFTVTGEASGTAAYLSRLQVLNYKQSTPKIDVWAAAAIFYRMLTGEVPRDFTKGENIWAVVLNNPPRPIKSINKDIPDKLAKVIDEALNENPGHGYNTAIEFKNAIVEAMQ